jgi:hypothetical protein
MFRRRVLLTEATLRLAKDAEGAGGTAQRVSREARVPQGPARSERSEMQGGKGALSERPA